VYWQELVDGFQFNDQPVLNQMDPLGALGGAIFHPKLIAEATHKLLECPPRYGNMLKKRTIHSI